MVDPARAAPHQFDDTGVAHVLGVALACVSQEHMMKKNLLLIAVLAVMLAGCVVVPARPLYLRAPGVVVY
ncbi:hypothetical protein [Paraburkholderia sediminicola]|uniref:hypothetical protein n=1 Tax=Paraburkholderia sediminicola TaxID=458836 RepID=UPI0038B79109